MSDGLLDTFLRHCEPASRPELERRARKALARLDPNGGEMEPQKDVAGMISEFVDLRAERVAIRNALERLLSLRDRAAAPDYEAVEPTNDEWLAAWDDAMKALNADA